MQGLVHAGGVYRNEFRTLPDPTQPLLRPFSAHELRHALEIARVPEVRDRDALRSLYRRIGRVEADGSRFESAAALATERTVRAELYGSQAARAASVRP